MKNLLENTCVRVSFIIMLRAVASVPCREYIKDKILNLVLTFFHQIHFFSVSLHSILIFRNFTLYLHCDVDARSDSEPCQTSKIKIFAKIVNSLKLLFLQKNSIFDIWQSSEYSFGWLDIIVRAFLKN